MFSTKSWAKGAHMRQEYTRILHDSFSSAVTQTPSADGHVDSSRCNISDKWRIFQSYTPGYSVACMV